jgi:hypothetical protein
MFHCNCVHICDLTVWLVTVHELTEASFLDRCVPREDDVNKVGEALHTASYLSHRRHVVDEI